MFALYFVSANVGNSKASHSMGSSVELRFIRFEKKLVETNSSQLGPEVNDIKLCRSRQASLVESNDCSCTTAWN